MSLIPTDKILTSVDRDDLHGSLDPHFWLDPWHVKSVVNGLVDYLAKLDPVHRSDFEVKAGALVKRLDRLDKELEVRFKAHRNASFILFHPSVSYLLQRYDLHMAGVVEPQPGIEPSPKDIALLVELVKTKNIKRLYSEPQLPVGPAKTIAETVGLPLDELDPLGSELKVKRIDLLIKANADALARGL